MSRPWPSEKSYCGVTSQWPNNGASDDYQATTCSERYCGASGEESEVGACIQVVYVMGHVQSAFRVY